VKGRYTRTHWKKSRKTKHKPGKKKKNIKKGMGGETGEAKNVTNRSAADAAANPSKTTKHVQQKQPLGGNEKGEIWMSDR